MLRGEAIRLVLQPELSYEHHYTRDLAAASTHDRGHGATRVAEEVFFLVMQRHDDDCRRACSERGSADLMFSHQKPTGYGGFRKEPSKAPGQCTPAQAAESFREERLWILPAMGG